jgi:hypothetical protein
MGTGSVALRPQSGGAISTVLVGLIGFASGALVVGTVALVRHPATGGGSARAVVSNGAPHESVPMATRIGRRIRNRPRGRTNRQRGRQHVPPA